MAAIRYIARSTLDPQDGLFVLSDETPDRMGDIVKAAGWDLDNFRSNPVALVEHDRTKVVGIWADVVVRNNQLVARLQLAEPGTSKLVDETRALVDQGILRATSVGFMPLDEKFDRSPAGGYVFKTAELLEASLVAVPANPNALRIAKSLGISEETRRLYFRGAAASAEPGTRRGTETKRSTSYASKGTRPMSIASRIQEAEAKLAALDIELKSCEEAADADDADSILQLEAVNEQIEKQSVYLETLRKTELNIRKRVEDAIAPQAQPEAAADPVVAKNRISQRPAAPAIISGRTVSRDKQSDLFVRNVLCQVRSFVTRQSIDDIIARDFRNDADLRIVSKAATAIGETGIDTWAEELCNAANQSFIDDVAALSIAASVDINRAQFNGSNTVHWPYGTPGQLAGGFVGEGSPIPVKQGSMAQLTLTPHKLGVITTISRELARYSNPSAEAIIRGLLVRDTAYTADGLFLDNAAASAGVRPAGLQTYATGSETAASAGTTLANIQADTKARLARLATNRMGERKLWIMDDQRALGAADAVSAAGVQPLAAEIQAGRFRMGTLYNSISAPDSIVWLLAGEFVAMAWYPSPDIEVSNSATLHMENTTPLAVGTAGTPNTVAAPTYSMFQHDALAIRLTWPWTFAAAPGSVQTITSCSW